MYQFGLIVHTPVYKIKIGRNLPNVQLRPSNTKTFSMENNGCKLHTPDMNHELFLVLVNVSHNLFQYFDICLSGKPTTGDVRTMR